MKRMCIKTLPPVLCIQLKRFGYDWEANRALKFDDYFTVSTVCTGTLCDVAIFVIDPIMNVQNGKVCQEFKIQVNNYNFLFLLTVTY